MSATLLDALNLKLKLDGTCKRFLWNIIVFLKENKKNSCTGWPFCSLTVSQNGALLANFPPNIQIFRNSIYRMYFFFASVCLHKIAAVQNILHWSVLLRKGLETVCMLSWLHAGLFNWKSMLRKTDRKTQWKIKYKWNTTILVSISSPCYFQIHLERRNALWQICRFICGFSQPISCFLYVCAGLVHRLLKFILKDPHFDSQLNKWRSWLNY